MCEAGISLNNKMMPLKKCAAFWKGVSESWNLFACDVAHGEVSLQSVLLLPKYLSKSLTSMATNSQLHTQAATGK